MTRWPRLTANKLAKAIERAGFVCIRSKGSHFAYRHPDGRGTSIPYHGSEIISPGLLNQIRREMEMTEDEFLALFEKG